MKRSRFVQLILPLMLFLYSFRHAVYGVDLLDGGYNSANFVYHDLKYMDSMWYFATWISNAAGHILTLLPYGRTMLGLNVYTSALVGGLTAAAYFFCTRRLKFPTAFVFVGEFLALSLCWLPTVVLYTYLTYAAIFVGTYFLYRGLTEDNRKFLFAAGLVFGLDVGVRFSNLAHMGFIISVWFYGVSGARKRKEILKDTAVCIMGYAAAFFAFLSFIALRFSLHSYFEGVFRLFDMTKEAEDYRTDSMLTGFFTEFLTDTGTYFLKRFALLIVVELLICLVIPKGKDRLKKILAAVTVVGFMGYLLTIRFCSLDYHTYGSMFYPCIFALLLSLIFLLLRSMDRKCPKEERLLCMLAALTLYLSSVGGNNAIYASMNNLFLVLPVVLTYGIRFFKEKQGILWYPCKFFALLLAALLMVQGSLFGWIYVYEEADGARDLSTEITQIPALYGMRTGGKKAEALEGLYDFLSGRELLEKTVVLYGDIPGISFFMGLKPEINIWGDLTSYNYEAMSEDLDEKEAAWRSGSGDPVVIMHRKYADYFKSGDEGVLPDGAQINAAKKLKELCLRMEETGFSKEPAYENELFCVFLKDE